jgi:hypothetical protein
VQNPDEYDPTRNSDEFNVLDSDDETDNGEPRHRVLFRKLVDDILEVVRNAPFEVHESSP